MSRCEHCGGNDDHDSSCPNSHEYLSPEQRIKQLEDQVDELEARVADLEALMGSSSREEIPDERDADDWKHHAE